MTDHPTTEPKPMTNRDYANEALRLADLSGQKEHPLPGGTGFYQLTDEQRTQMLMRALVYATLARQPRTVHVLPPGLRPPARWTLLDTVRRNPVVAAVHLSGAFAVAAFALWVSLRIGGAVS